MAEIQETPENQIAIAGPEIIPEPKIGSCTSFGQLKSVIVGNESKFTKTFADFTFKHFYQQSLNQQVYDQNKYKLTYEMSLERNEDLDNLAKVIESRGPKVYRPDDLTGTKIKFKTPEFESEISPASNVRDVSIVYRDSIIETPPFVRNRYFENKHLYKVFFEHFTKGYKWIRFPHIELTEKTMDLEPWNSDRDYFNFDFSKYVPCIDGAQFLRMGKDVIVNINSYNHYLGYLWVKSFFPDTEFHLINVADNHIDGSIVCLKPGVFLINPEYQRLKDILPKKFKDYKFLCPKVTTRKTQGYKLASDQGMDVNILSINEKEVITNKNAHYVNDLLDANGFNVIPVKLDHCELFGGGIHCSTLDLHREDDFIDYGIYS